MPSMDDELKLMAKILRDADEVNALSPEAQARVRAYLKARLFSETPSDA